ncbi:hypothetical protein BH10PAT1_BH10PAT1_0530 [soil metagenome]
MITVTVKNLGKFSFDENKIKEVIIKTLEKNNINNAVVDVAIAGREFMDDLNAKYYKDEVYEHPIFTFPESIDSNFIFPPDGKTYLGEMVINYGMAIETAKEQNKLTDDVISELAEHGSLHLVGIHH